MAVDFTFTPGTPELQADFDATVGHEYEVFVNTNSSNWYDAIAASNPQTGTITGADMGTLTGGKTYITGLVDFDTKEVIAVAVLQDGSTSEFVLPATFTYDGSTHASVTFTAPVGHTGVNWTFEAIDYNFNGLGNTFVLTTGSSQTANLTLAPPASGDIILMLWETGQRDWAVARGTVGSSVVNKGTYSFNGPSVIGGGGTDDTHTFSGPGRVGVAFDAPSLEPAPAWTYLTDGSSRVASYQIDRGRQFEFDKTDTGTARVSINDRDGTLDPTNSASPYFGLIEPLIQIRIELWNPVTLEYQTRFRGWIEDYDYSVDFAYQDAAGDTKGVTRLQISCVDIFEILTAIEMQPGAFGDTLPALTPADPGYVQPGNIFFDNATAKVRCEQVLGDANIDGAFFVVFTMNVWMQESIYSPSDNVLQVIQDAADAEFPTVSNVYTDRFGRIAVHGRLAKFDPDGTASGADWDFHRWKIGDEKATIDSPSDTAQLRVLSYNRGLSKIFNQALCTPSGINDANSTTVTGSDVAGQVFSDATSIGIYGIRSWSAENLLIGAQTGDPLTTAGAGILTGNNAMDETLAFATYIVENYKTPRNRITSLGLKSILPTDSRAATTWDMLCKADISDVVEVTVRGPGDSDTAYIFNGEEFFIEGVHETARPATGEYAMVELTLDLSAKAHFPIGGGGGVGVE